MATLVRNPLATRPHGQHPSTNVPPAYPESRRLSVPKRSRSPEPSFDSYLSQSSKRIKATPPASVNESNERKKEKERMRAENEEEFRSKYTRAFPQWVFYFDIDPVNSEIAAWKSQLEKRVMLMHAVRPLSSSARSEPNVSTNNAAYSKWTISSPKQ